MPSYLLCATPRSGSTLLCDLLRATGVAGKPESYFREPDEPRRARSFGLVDRFGNFDYRNYVRAAVAAGTTPNGVCGARLMWGSVQQLIAKLNGATGPEAACREASAERDVLDTVFGQPRFVCLWREDVVAQAVSWLRAEQTGFWHPDESSGPGEQPRFDGRRLHAFVRMIEEHNARWRQWFEGAGIEPYGLRHEDLIADVDGEMRALLDFLGIEPPAGHRFVARRQRQADEINRDWVARYNEWAADNDGDDREV